MLRHSPIAPWLSSYKAAWLRDDASAGLTVAAVVIPQAMAYAVIAGLSVEVGLYTALMAMLIYPLLGSSRPLSVSSTSAIAMLTATAIASVAGSDLSLNPSAVAAILALMVGGLLVLARLLRLGFLANFISLPVLVGFKAGVGVVIVIGQLKSVLGVSVTSKTTIGTLLELPGLVPHAQGATVLVAIFGVAMLLGLPKLWPKVAAPLVWVPLSIVASAALGLEAFGVTLVGAVPSGLPSLAMPELSLVSQLWPAALGIALMSFTESVATARTFCGRGDPPVSANRELLALGAANMASAFAGGMPVGGGASQTAVSEQSGVRSQMAQWINAVAVLLVIMVLAPVISLLPKAALAALILVTAASMIKLDAFIEIARVRRMELLWALATVAGVIFIGTLEGILFAVVISILTLFYQANHPPVYAVAYNRDKQIFRRVGENDRDQTFPGLLILRTEGRLTFANAAAARDKMQVLIEQTQPRVLVLECSAIPDIEYTALMMLTEADENLRKRGITLWLAAVNPDLLKTLQQTSLGAALGRARMFFNLHKVLEAWQQRAETVTASPQGYGADEDKRHD